MERCIPIKRSWLEGKRSGTTRQVLRLLKIWAHFESYYFGEKGRFSAMYFRRYTMFTQSQSTSVPELSTYLVCTYAQVWLYSDQIVVGESRMRRGEEGGTRERGRRKQLNFQWELLVLGRKSMRSKVILKPCPDS